MRLNDAFDLLGIQPSTLYQTGYSRYRRLSKKTHPDKGGSHEDFVRIQEAWDTVKPLLWKNPPVLMIPHENLYRRWLKESEGPGGDWIYYHKDKENRFVLHLGSRAHTFYEIDAADRCIPASKCCVVSDADYVKYFRKDPKYKWFVPLKR